MNVVVIKILQSSIVTRIV